MKVYNFLILVVVILAFLLLHQCNKNKSIGMADETVTKIDTLYKEGKIDTVFFPNKIYVTDWLKPEVIHDTSYVVTDGKIDTLNSFTTNYSDSAIDATIVSKVKGDLISSQISYIKKFPKFIYKTDTITINKETTITKNKWGIYAGAIVGGNKDVFSLQPSILIKTNKTLQFSVGYELIQKSYNIGVWTKIKNPF
jgi:hypothetical protein